jgi:hypothetical protein
MCGAGLIGLLYWLFAALYRGEEPLKVTILYRFGDTDYLPLIYSLARGHYSEFLDISSYGKGLLPFPIVSILPYAFGVAAIGDAGFGAVDALISIIRFLLLYTIFAYCADAKSSKLVLAGTALAFIPMLYLANAWNYQLTSQPDYFRYPRPYVTQVFTIAAIFTTLLVFRQLRLKEGRPLLSFGHGLLIGLTAQVDFYASIGFVLATALILGGFIIFDARWKQVVIASAFVCLGCAVALVPLAIQSLSVPEYVLIRWGMFVHPRSWSLVYLPAASVISAVLVAIIPSIRGLVPKGFREISEREWDLRIVFLAMIAGALLAPSAAVLLMGKVIQGYHFAQDLQEISSIALVIIMALAVISTRLNAIMVLVITGILSAFPAVEMARDARFAARSKIEQQRVFEDGSFTSIANYRNDLAALVRELAAEKYKEAKTLGTFDQQLGMLWATQEFHTLFIPDTFLSLASDEVIERRTILLSHLVGMSEEEFLKKANQLYFQWRFLTLAEWQATKNFLASSPDDYDDAQLREAINTLPLDYWTTEMPRSARERLRMHYDLQQPTNELPDLVILTNEASYAQLPGPSQGFTLTYQNKSFRVFLRERQATRKKTPLP